MARALCMLMLTVMLTCCESSKPRRMTVWDVYDVRHPVPAGSSVPSSRATYYDQFYDNDEFYRAPIGLCAPGDAASMGCE